MQPIETYFMELSKPNANPKMLITQSGINRLPYIMAIKEMARGFYHDTYHLALPTDDISLEEYFEEIAYAFGTRERTQNKIKREIVSLAKSSRDPIFLLITDFENDLHLDAFAKFMRSILDQVDGKIKLITIGGERLANLQTNMGIHSYFNYFNKVQIDVEYSQIPVAQQTNNDISIGNDNLGVVIQGHGNTVYYHNHEKS